MELGTWGYLGSLITQNLKSELEIQNLKMVDQT